MEIANTIINTPTEVIGCEISKISIIKKELRDQDFLIELETRFYLKSTT